MELRSSRRNEYKELQITLNGLGVYEEGMELQEMRQILNALQMSVNEEETNFLECDMQQAIRESELDFMPSQDGRVLNSTMMSIHPNISPCSSPDLPTEPIIVYAEVHHAMDWSPPNKRLPRKRFASPDKAVNNERIPPELELIDEMLEPDAKRFYDVPVPIANIKIQEKNMGDNADITVDVSNNNLENSLQEPSNSSHEIHGPISVRRIHDSGFNISNKIPHSSFNSTTSNATNLSNASLNNIENSTAELANSNHEIRGPMSVRRIHDSGVNISCQMPHSSLSDNSSQYFLSNHSIEDSEQVSTSSAVNLYDFNDSEPSI